MRRPLPALVMALFATLAPAKAEVVDPMRFEVVATAPDCQNCVVVRMSGEVVENTSLDFATFVARERMAKRLPPEPRSGEGPAPGDATVYVALDSPGGNVAPALVIGRRIRELGWNTIVARPRLDDGAGVVFEPAGCYSACSMMLLGGVDRLVLPRSRVGVHQFSPEYDDDETFTAGDMREAIRDYGRTVTTVYEYVRAMGVGNEYFIATMGTPFASMNVVPESEWLVLGLATRRLDVRRNATIAEVERDTKQRDPAAVVAVAAGGPDTMTPALDGVWRFETDAAGPRVIFSATADVDVRLTCSGREAARLDVRFVNLDPAAIERLRAAAFGKRRFRIGSREVEIGAVPPPEREAQLVSMSLDRRDLSALAASAEPFPIAVINRLGIATPRAATLPTDGIGTAVRTLSDACAAG